MERLSNVKEKLHVPQGREGRYELAEEKVQAILNIYEESEWTSALKNLLVQHKNQKSFNSEEYYMAEVAAKKLSELEPISSDKYFDALTPAANDDVSMYKLAA